MKLSIIIGLIILGITGVAWTQFTIFVVQPIGALPDGRTLIISRTADLKFVDSADAICERRTGGVSLLCRGIVLGKVAENMTIYARLPYSESLYRWSTGGATYDR